MYANAMAQNISRIEYFINSDPGFGNGTAITGFSPSPNIANYAANINISAAATGVNTIYFRALDANGSWSLTNSYPIYKTIVSVLPNIVRAEYFINTDPGFGNATPFSLPASNNISNQAETFNISSATVGVNILYVRVEDANGNWSLTNTFPFYKTNITVAPNIVRAEYFINTDPGFGHGTAFSLPVSTNISNQSETFNISSATAGVNILYVRVEDANGNWSLTNTFPFVKGSGAVAGNIVSLEYFIDTDPGFGMATPISLVPAQNISNYSFNADVTSASFATHNLFVRAKDVNGIWSLTNVLSFIKTTGVGISQITDASSDYTTYPSPATDKVTLQCTPNKSIDKIELLDIQGKLIRVKSAGNTTEKQIDISMLNNGIYFIKITSGGDVVYKKMVKE